jgi:hypothetical protein
MRLMEEETRRFPALTPNGGWQMADIEDKTHDFFVERGARVTSSLLAQAIDDASIGKLLRRSIRNWLIDQARKTGVGSVRRALEKILTADDAFEEGPPSGHWRLAGTFGDPFAGDDAMLIDATQSVRNIRIPPWSSSTRRAPLADRASMVALCRAVLTAADGSVELGRLVRVMLARFPVVLDPVVVPLPDDAESKSPEMEMLTPEGQVIAAEDALAAAVTAAEVVGMLTPTERLIVPHLDNHEAIQQALSLLFKVFAGSRCPFW